MTTFGRLPGFHSHPDPTDDLWPRTSELELSSAFNGGRHWERILLGIKLSKLCDDFDDAMLGIGTVTGDGNKVMSAWLRRRVELIKRDEDGDS